MTVYVKNYYGWGLPRYNYTNTSDALKRDYIMTIQRFIVISGTLITSAWLTGCASQSPLCEDILEVKAQAQQCKVLEQAMRSPKNPQMALTARQRFEAECENLRYYRDDYDTICKNGEKPISKQDTKNKP